MEVRTDEPLNNGEHEVDACIDVLHKGAVLIERRLTRKEKETYAPRPTDRRGDRLFPSLTGRGR